MTGRQGLAAGALSVLIALVMHGSFQGEGLAKIGRLVATPTSLLNMEIENRTKTRFLYDDEFGKQIGTPVHILAGHQSVGYANFLKTAGNALFDSTTAGRNGFFCADGVYRLLRAWGTAQNTGSPNCTTLVVADGNIIAKLRWNGDKMYWKPTADSTGNWIAPPRVVADSGTIVSITVKAAASAPVNLDQPIMTFVFAREI